MTDGENASARLEVSAVITSLARKIAIPTSSLVAGERMRVSVVVKNIGTKSFPDSPGRVVCHLDWLNGSIVEFEEIRFNKVGELLPGNTITLESKNIKCVKDGYAAIRMDMFFSEPVSHFFIVNTQGDELKVKCAEDKTTDGHVTATWAIPWSDRRGYKLKKTI